MYISPAYDLIAMSNLNGNMELLFERYEAVHPNTVFMQVHESKSFFCFKNSDTTTIALPVGFELIYSRYFKHTPPTYDEIEYAINDIEDEIEKVAPVLPMNGHRLVTNTSFIREIAHLCGLKYSNTMHLSLEALEDLFSQYAEVALGRPPRPHESDISPRFYAQLLILREYMHHFKFDQITVLNG